MANWKNDGDIQCIGRMDNLVKVRGHRIELSEIENQLLKYSGIKDVAVVIKEGKDYEKFLCGYFVSEKPLSTVVLKKYLAKELHQYMIPMFFVRLEKMPLNPNGKVDRKALPNPEKSITEDMKYVPPQNKIQELMESIWRDVLGIESKIGITEEFFDIGGDSFKIVILASKIKDIFDIEVKISLLLNYPTIEKISDLIVNNFATLNEKTYFVFNKSKSEKIFCFPPTSGYGIVYNGLANIINEYSFYAFNFIETEDRISKYADIIMEIQPEGEYKILGYSAGGNLAFEVSKELERRGAAISDIILIDSKARNRQLTTEEMGLYNDRLELEKLIIEDERFVMFKDEIIDKSIKCQNYFRDLIVNGVI